VQSTKQSRRFWKFTPDRRSDLWFWDRLLLRDVGTRKLCMGGQVTVLAALFTLLTPVWSWRSYLMAVIHALMIPLQQCVGAGFRKSAERCGQCGQKDYSYAMLCRSIACRKTLYRHYHCQETRPTGADRRLHRGSEVKRCTSSNCSSLMASNLTIASRCSQQKEARSTL